jgi:hypothetical protein
MIRPKYTLSDFLGQQGCLEKNERVPTRERHVVDAPRQNPTHKNFTRTRTEKNDSLEQRILSGISHSHVLCPIFVGISTFFFLILEIP